MQKTYNKTTLAEQHGVGASVIVPGLGQWSGAVGTEDDQSPLTPDYYFEVGSCTKTFMSALILQLEDSGKLAIGDPIYKYLPAQYPNVDPNITIKQLLEHSSGIYDYLNDDPNFTLLNMAYFTDPGKRWTPEEILQTYVGPSNFQAGTSYQYSNTNYLLLGLIVHTVTGNSAAKEIHRRFLAPLGLTHTFCCWEDYIPSGFCHNWTPGDTLMQSNDYFSILKAAQLTMANTAGGVVSIPSELAKWSAALYAGQFFSLTAMKELLTFHTWSDGLTYGLGVMKAPYYSKVFYGHTGGLPGFETDMFTNPKDTVTVVLYMNSDMEAGDVTGNDYLVAILDEVYRKPSSGVPMPPQASSDWVGVYPNPVPERATIVFSTDTPGPAMVKIYDALGRSVRTIADETEGIGQHSVSFERGNLPSGTYFYTIELPSSRRLSSSMVVE